MMTDGNQIIKKTLIPNKFFIYWQDVKDSEIVLDFNPLIGFLTATNKLEADYCLVHFQRKPVGLRKWGIFSQGEYFSVDKITSSCPAETLSLPDTLQSLQPISVIWFPSSKLTVINKSSLGIIEAAKDTL